jgi:cell division protein FtsB
MKKYKNLAEYYKVKKIGLLIFPITSVMLFIFAIIDMVEKPKDLSLGLLLIGLASIFIFLYIIGLAFTNYYIKKLEKEEALKEEKVKKAEELEKEMTEKDERIKELEEELKQSKNIKQ